MSLNEQARERHIAIRIGRRTMFVLAGKAIVVVAVGLVGGYFMALEDAAEVPAYDSEPISVATAMILCPLVFGFFAAAYELTGLLLGSILDKLLSPPTAAV